jgi:hypothetical protein
MESPSGASVREFVLSNGFGLRCRSYTALFRSGLVFKVTIRRLTKTKSWPVNALKPSTDRLWDLFCTRQGSNLQPYDPKSLALRAGKDFWPI